MTHSNTQHITRVTFESGGETLVGYTVSQKGLRPPRTMLLHGAGESNQMRARPLALRLLAHGVPTFAWDFSGHGESTGTLSGSSLQRRAAEARTAVQFLDNTLSLTACGFSMGAHTALDLLPTGRIANLALFYPAIYSSRAADASFGPDFSKAIREAKSWRTSPVLQHLRGFTGKLLIVIGDQDSVIPDGVVPLLEASAEKALSREVITVPHGTHNLMPRIYDDEALFESIASRIARMASDN